MKRTVTWSKGKIIFTSALVLGVTGGVIGLACSIDLADSARVGSTRQEVVYDATSGEYVMEDSGLHGYDYRDANCHNYANAGMDAGNDGIVACAGNTGVWPPNSLNGPPPNSPYGHTVNWDRPEAGVFCIGEPQRPGSVACCFNQAGAGPPDLSAGAGQDCARKICYGQVCPPGSERAGQWPQWPPVALGAGVQWNTGWTECDAPIHRQNMANCLTCCARHKTDQTGGYTDPCNPSQHTAATDDQKDAAAQFYDRCELHCACLTGTPPNRRRANMAPASMTTTAEADQCNEYGGGCCGYTPSGDYPPDFDPNVDDGGPSL